VKPYRFNSPGLVILPPRGGDEKAHQFHLFLNALLALIVALGATAATAQPIPTVGYGHATLADPRIRTLMYDPDRIVAIHAVFGYQLMIQFGADERIEDVAIGDGAAWQVTPNKGASLLFIKPVDQAVATNMTVVTDRRSYLFQLSAGAAKAMPLGDMTYVIRFAYPPEPVVVATAPPPPPPPPQRRNAAYTYAGARDLLPSEVFDDGKFTYFKWPESGSTPALFLVDRGGGESLVNYSYRDGYQVVEQVSRLFRLRNGKDVTTIINQAWREPTPGEDAPKPADAKTARAAHRGQGRP
jgi:type IV secretion system protein VirB9